MRLEEMRNSRHWVVRIALDPTQAEKMAPWMEILRHAGVLMVHRVDEHGTCFDILPHQVGDTTQWARQESERIQSFGFNAVAAPMVMVGEKID